MRQKNSYTNRSCKSHCSHLANVQQLFALEGLVKERVNHAKTHLILITHLFPTSFAYIQLINKIFPVDLVIAIPYSAHSETIEKIRKEQIEVVVPNSIEDAFTYIPKIVSDRVKSKSSTPFVVQEVGGYLAASTRSLFQYKNLKGIVEESNNGHWRYTKVGPHSLPIVSTALSPLKEIEVSLLAESVAYSIERLLREDFGTVLKGANIGLLGYGRMGNSCAHAIKGREAVVSVYDINPAKNILAQFHGYHTVPKRQIFMQNDLIVGCSGRTTIKAEDVPYLKHHAILVSTSAKDDEFDLRGFDEVATKVEINEHLWHYTTSDDKCFYVLNRGTPVNFRDRSILGSALDLMYSELFLSMWLVANRKIPPGLQKSPTFIQDEVAKSWMSVYNTAFSEDETEMMWSYPASLNHSIPRTFLYQTTPGDENCSFQHGL